MLRASRFAFAGLVVTSLGCGSNPAAQGPDVSGAVVNGKVVSGGRPLALRKSETVCVALVGQGGADAVTVSGYVSEGGMFEIKGPSGKGLPGGKYKVAIASEVYGGDADRFEGKFDVDSTPLLVDVPPEGTLTIEIDLSARKVSKK